MKCTEYASAQITVRVSPTVHSPEPAPESSQSPPSATSAPPTVARRGRRRSSAACSSGVTITYRPVMNAERAGVVSCRPHVWNT